MNKEIAKNIKQFFNEWRNSNFKEENLRALLGYIEGVVDQSLTGNQWTDITSSSINANTLTVSNGKKK